MSQPTLTLLPGDCRQELAALPAQSVHCCVTSPPYFGLRDYGTATWEGGDPTCQHGIERWEGKKQTQGAQSDHSSATDRLSRTSCDRCGAIRHDQQIGLEATPEEFIDALVEVFYEVWRVLRDDGTLWINLGDSFCSIGHKKASSGYGTTGLAGGKAQEHHPLRRENNGLGLKSKDLMMLPARVAIALQAAGWYLRSDIIWAKPSPMPENVLDRPTKSYEHLFLLTKRPRYYYDADAIREPAGPIHATGQSSGFITDRVPVSKKKSRLDPLTGNHGTMGHDGKGKRYEQVYNNPAGRNKRDVWTVASAGFSEAHFATFPEALVEPCLLAGTSEAGCCPTCLAPYRRAVERDPMVVRHGPKSGGYGSRTTDGLSGTMVAPASSRTIGWAPSCRCDAGEPVPCTVLDPFFGAGTIGVVARRLHRSCVGIELNPGYLAMARRRIASIPPTLFSAAGSGEEGAGEQENGAARRGQVGALSLWAGDEAAGEHVV